jgi:hypothetical protein
VENIVLFYHVHCSVLFPAISVLHYQFSVSHKIVWYSCLYSDQIHYLTPSGSAHLFGINRGCFCLCGVSVGLTLQLWTSNKKGYQLDCPDHYFHTILYLRTYLCSSLHSFLSRRFQGYFVLTYICSSWNSILSRRFLVSTCLPGIKRFKRSTSNSIFDYFFLKKPRPYCLNSWPRGRHCCIHNALRKKNCIVLEWLWTTSKQVCQMVCFQTKNPNLGT